MKLFTLFLVISLNTIRVLFSQDLGDAIKYKDEAEIAFTNSDYAKASHLINKAINIMSALDKDVPVIMKELKSQIDHAHRSEILKAERNKNDELYNNHLMLAKTALNSKEYEEARNQLEISLSYRNSREARDLYDNVYNIKNRDQVSEYVSDAEILLTERHKEEALILFEKAYSIDSNAVPKSLITDLQIDVNNYYSLIQTAEDSYINGRLQEAIDSLNKAVQTMSLKKEHHVLYNEVGFLFWKKHGEMNIKSGKIKVAEQSYSKAKLFMNKTDQCHSVFIPVFFSPNDDKLNDLWCIKGNCLSKVNIKIYNRWGQTLYQSDSHQNCWDGKVNGELVKDEFVFFMIEYETNENKVFEDGGTLRIIH